MRAREAVQRALRAVRGPGAGRPRSGAHRVRPPRTTVRTGPALPGWTVRLLVALTVLAAGPAVAGSSVQWLVLGALAVLLGVAPNGALVPLGIGLMAAMLAFLSTTAWWTLPVLLLATHGLLVLGAVATATAWRGRVELRVLADLVPRVVVVQAFAQLAGVAARLLGGAAAVPWLAVLAVAALAVLVAALLHQLTRAPLPPSPAQALARGRAQARARALTRTTRTTRTDRTNRRP